MNVGGDTPFPVAAGQTPIYPLMSKVMEAGQFDRDFLNPVALFFTEAGTVTVRPFNGGAADEFAITVTQEQIDAGGGEYEYRRCMFSRVNSSGNTVPAGGIAGSW